MVRHRGTLTLVIVVAAALGIAGAAAGLAQSPGEKGKPDSAGLKAKNEAALAWYAGHGIAVETVVKDGYAWLVPTESALRQAAAAKGVAYVPKQKGAWTKGK